MIRFLYFALLALAGCLTGSCKTPPPPPHVPDASDASLLGDAAVLPGLFGCAGVCTALHGLGCSLGDDAACLRSASLWDADGTLRRPDTLKALHCADALPILCTPVDGGCTLTSKDAARSIGFVCP